MSVNKKRLDTLMEIFRDAIEKEITAPVAKKLGEGLASQIKKRTRLGYGVNKFGARIKLDALSDDYVDKRVEYKENLSDATTAKRSNLTATGQLLDAIKGGGERAKPIVSISGKRSRELTGSKSRKSNAQVSNFVAMNGRPFFGLTTSERKAFVREVKTILLAGVKKRLRG